MEKNHSCLVFGCSDKWKSGFNGFYACEEHENILYEEFIKPVYSRLGINLEGGSENE